MRFGCLLFGRYHGEYPGVLLSILSVDAIALDRSLEAAGLKPFVYLRLVDGQPLWFQILLLVLVFDFVQWLIHNLLQHRGAACLFRSGGHAHDKTY